MPDALPLSADLRPGNSFLFYRHLPAAGAGIFDLLAWGFLPCDGHRSALARG